MMRAGEFVRGLILLYMALPLSACGAQPEEAKVACWSYESPHTTKALALQLERDGVAYTVSSARGVCVAAERRRSLDEAVKKLDAFHYEFALKPRDSCEEKEMLDWLKANDLPSEVKPTTDSNGQPSGVLIRVPVIKPEDVPRYREKLASAHGRDGRCRK